MEILTKSTMNLITEKYITKGCAYHTRLDLRSDFGEFRIPFIREN